MQVRQAISLVTQSYNQWSQHQAPRLGASVAFYSLLSFAPLLVLVTAVIALVFGHESAQASLVNEARQWIGDRCADTVQLLLKNAQKPSSGIFASVVAFITLLFGASGVFTELQDALNIIWDTKLEAASGFIGLIKQRLFSFGMVLSIGFVLLVSLLISAALAYIGKALAQLLPVPAFVMEALNFLISFAVITVLFGLMFKYVPAAKVPWRDVWIGAVGTALLFTIGKMLLGLYLGKASVGSTYGAAGSLVAVIVWIYYSAQIFFFGAEFTHVYSEAHETKSVSQEPRSPEAESVKAEAEHPELAPRKVAAGVGLPPPPLWRPDNPATAQQRAVNMPSQPTMAPQPAPAFKRRQSLPDNSSRPETATRQTKPRLLMAAGLGFLLGRLFERHQHQ
jgi:membrane protein